MVVVSFAPYDHDKRLLVASAALEKFIRGFEINFGMFSENQFSRLVGPISNIAYNLQAMNLKEFL